MRTVIDYIGGGYCGKIYRENKLIAMTTYSESREIVLNKLNFFLKQTKQKCFN